MPTSFTYTGSHQSFVVPVGVTSIEVDLYGAAAGAARFGNRVKGTLAVTPGDTLRIYVGGTGGFNGGASPGGGGATDIRATPYALADRLMVAGGAGAFGLNGLNNTGGATTGGGASAGGNGGTGGSGAGGTAGAAGSNDVPGTAGTAGSLGNGGAGGAGGNDYPNGIGGLGGGGGGGYYGGGGGGGGAVDQLGASVDVYVGGNGGYGSNYLGAATSTLVQSAVRSGNGLATLTFVSNVAPNAPVPSDPAPGANVDLAAGYTFAAPFSDPNPGDTLTAVAFRIKVNGTGTWDYWDDGLGALVSSEVWNPTSDAEVAIPAAILSNGVTYDWGIAYEDDHSNQSDYSTTQTVVGNTKPTVVIDGPTDPVTDTSKPPITWTSSDPESDTRTDFQVIIETGSPGGVPGFGTQVGSSGITSGNPGTWTPTTSLDDAEDFRAFVRVKAAGQWSDWDTWDFSTDFDAPTAPTYTVATDPATGRNTLTVTGTHATADFADVTFRAERSYDETEWTEIAEAEGNGTPGATPVEIEDPYPRTYKTAYYRVFTVAEV